MPLLILLAMGLVLSNGPAEFGRLEVKRALEKCGLEERLQDVEIRVAGQGEPESYRLSLEGGRALIEGADGTGAMYGALEMAERVRNAGKGAFEGDPVQGRPYLKDRGLNIFLTLPWDYEKNNTDHDPKALEDPGRWWFQNEDYWRTLFDGMARCRLNWLDLHGTWDVSVTDAPNLYAYFIQSEKYPKIGVAPKIKAANLERLNRVIEMAHDRGIRVSLMAYEARIRIPQNPDPPYEETEELAYDYTLEMVEKMIRQAPGLDAIGFRIGESGRGGEFFQSYLEAVEASGRDIPLITRSWVTRKAKVVPLARGASDFTVEIKYNGEHWGAPYMIAGGRVAGWYSYSFEDYLSDSGDALAKKMWPGHAAEGGGSWPDQPYKIVWQVRANGTHRIFPFCDPGWVRSSILCMKIGTASGYTVEPFNAYYPASPHYYLANPEDRYCEWIHERDAMYLMLWGRLGYDPDTPEEVFDQAMEDLLGPGSRHLASAWKSASRVIPVAFSAYSLGPDHRSHAPELEWGGNTEMFIAREPFDSHAFMSMKEAFALRATGGKDGRIRPYEAAQRLQRYSRVIQSSLDTDASADERPLDARQAGRRREIRMAVTMLGHLADYYTHRFEAAYFRAMADGFPVRLGDRMAASCMQQALEAWRGLSESKEAGFYKPFTERLRMHTNTFHWKNELPRVEAEAGRLVRAEGPRGELELPMIHYPPPSAVLTWASKGDEVVCTLPADSVDRAWLLVKPLPSSTFFHKIPMEPKDGAFEARFLRENCGHMIAAEVELDLGIRRIPAWGSEKPYLVIPSRQGPTPPYYSSEESMAFLDPRVLDPEKHGLLLLGFRAWNFHRWFDVATQRKLLDAVERGMTLLVLQQDYTSGRYPLTWLPVPPKLENRNLSVFDPAGALGLERIEAANIIWQPFLPAEGWEVFGNGGMARRKHGKGEIWMVQARLVQNMHIPDCARTLVKLLEAGGTDKPVILVDPGTEGAHYATSVFADLMNAHEIPFLTLGEVIAGEQGVSAFEPVPGRTWSDVVLGGEGPGIMKAFLEKKVLDAASAPLPRTREEWEARRKVLKKEWMRCMGLDPLPPRTPLNARVTGVLKREGYRVEMIVFESRPDFLVTAHLYVPDGQEGKKLPVIVNPHGHWACKKAQPEVQIRAIFQALNGYLAMVVDSPGHSFEGDALIERRYAGTHWDLPLILGSANANAVYVWDLVRALDYLETRPEADMTRVGISGTSGGGHATLSAFATEDRFTCAIPVCYATSLEANFNNGCECNHVPGYLQVGDRAHVLGLSAPKPILVMGVDVDWEFPPEGTRLTGEKLKAIWSLYGREQDAKWQIFKGEHGYFHEMREAMMGFFDYYLKGKGDGAPVAEPKIRTEPENSRELLCLPEVPEGLRTMRGIAKDNLAMARPVPFEAVAALNGGLPERTPLNLEVLDTGSPDGTRWITFESEPGLRIPGILRLPAGKPRAAVVLVSEQGKTVARDAFPVDELVAKGFACLLIDVRGFGELQGLDPKLMSYLGTADPFAMGWDAARAVEVMLAYSPKVAVVGRGACGAQIAMFAALMEPRTAFAAGLSGIRGYEECFLDEVPTYAIQPRAAYSAPLSHLRSLVKAPAFWSFRGEAEPDLVGLLMGSGLAF